MFVMCTEEDRGTGSVSSRCRGTVYWVLTRRPDPRRATERFVFFVTLETRDAEAGLAVPTTATLQRLHREVQNPFKSITIKFPMVLSLSFLLLFL